MSSRVLLYHHFRRQLFLLMIQKLLLALDDLLAAFLE